MKKDQRSRDRRPDAYPCRRRVPCRRTRYPRYRRGNLTQNIMTAIEEVAQTAKQIEQYQTQLQQYENMLQKRRAGGLHLGSGAVDHQRPDRYDEHPELLQEPARQHRRLPGQSSRTSPTTSRRRASRPPAAAAEWAAMKQKPGVGLGVAERRRPMTRCSGPKSAARQPASGRGDAATLAVVGPGRER